VVSGSGFGEKGCEGSGEVGGMGAAVTPPRPSVPALLPAPAISPTKSEGLKNCVLGGI